MKFELERLPQYDNASIVAEIKRVAALVPTDLKLTTARFDEYAKVSSSTIQKRFGGWHNALQAAGLADRYSGKTVSSKMRTQAAKVMTDEQLVAELQRVASEFETGTFTQPQFNSHSNIAASAISRRFGSWNKGLHAAGLRPVTMGRRYTGDDYFENLLTVWTHFGRRPKYQEMNMPPSNITAAAYAKRWGNWTKALIAFIDKVNSDRPEEPTQPLEAKVPHVLPRTPLKPEDQRKISIGLRYNIFRRDNFKCVLCGNSPATDPMCKLHVDHILPFSKNGKTVQDNLRTLCGDCNIGKSNKMEIIQQKD